MTASWRMKGKYIKNCNCVPSCSCDTTGIPSPHKHCEGMAGMHIVEGHFGTAKLDGLTWVAVYYWPGPLHEGNGKIQAFIDQKATEEQRNALLQILSGQAGNPWFEFLASTVKTMLEPKFLPIQFEFDKDRRKARLVVPGFLETASAPLSMPNADVQQRYTVKMPAGMEYKEFEAAKTVVLKGTGEIKFNHQNTHSSLAIVEHTEKGLVA